MRAARGTGVRGKEAGRWAGVSGTGGRERREEAGEWTGPAANGSARRAQALGPDAGGPGWPRRPVDLRLKGRSGTLVAGGPPAGGSRHGQKTECSSDTQADGAHRQPGLRLELGAEHGAEGAALGLRYGGEN